MPALMLRPLGAVHGVARDRQPERVALGVVVRQLETGRAIRGAFFADFAQPFPIADRVAEIRVVAFLLGHFIGPLANVQRDLQIPQAQRRQHPVHVRQAWRTALVEPMAHAALGHAQAFSQLTLRDLAVFHVGPDQRDPFIHGADNTSQGFQGNKQFVVIHKTT